MPKSGSELLFLALIIAGFMLFNYVAQQLAKKAREQQEAQEAEASAPPPEDEPLEDIWGRRPAAPVAEPAAPAAPPPVALHPAPAPAAAPRPLSAQRLFRTRQDLRQAIVAMTVLGPCRALDPHERR